MRGRHLARAGRRRACLWLAGILLAACTPTDDGTLELGLPPMAMPLQAKPSDLALADLAKGDYAAAERHALAALEREPTNPYALLAAGLVYENRGNVELARHYYEVLATMHPPATATIGTRVSSPPRTLAEIGLAGYRRVEGGRPVPSLQTSPPAGTYPPVTAAVEPIEARFAILRALFDAGLVAEEEYGRRRAANLGGLLPYSGPSPAARTNRQPPAPEQFVQRLQSLANAFETRALGADEYQAERTAILDGLLPAVSSAGRAPPPPRDELAMAAAIGRLERLRVGGLISAEEQARERQALEQAWAPPPIAVVATPAPPLTAQSAAGAPQRLVPAGRATKPGGVSVHLASLATEAQALDEWERLKRRFAELKGLTPRVTPVDLGGAKGKVYRLLAGPLADRAAVEKVCRALQRARQYCAPSS